MDIALDIQQGITGYRPAFAVCCCDNIRTASVCHQDKGLIHGAAAIDIQLAIAQNIATGGQNATGLHIDRALQFHIGVGTGSSAGNTGSANMAGSQRAADNKLTAGSNIHRGIRRNGQGVGHFVIRHQNIACHVIIGMGMGRNQFGVGIFQGTVGRTFDNLRFCLNRNITAGIRYYQSNTGRNVKFCGFTVGMIYLAGLCHNDSTGIASCCNCFIQIVVCHRGGACNIISGAVFRCITLRGFNRNNGKRSRFGFCTFRRGDGKGKAAACR